MFKFFQGRLIFTRLALIVASSALIAIGILTIYSVGHPAEPSPAGNAEEFAQNYKRQIIFAILGITGFIAINLIKYRRLGESSYWIFGIVVFMLVILLIGKFISLPFVEPRNNAYRWIQISIAGRDLPSIQPSEFCKLAYILALAWYLRFRSNYSSFHALIGPFLFTLLPMILIVLEPDLGTVMLMMPVLFSLLFVAGARLKHLLLVLLLAVIASPVMWMLMEPYQKRRVATVVLQSKAVQQKLHDHPKISKIFLGRKFDQRYWSSGPGFHLERSKIAIASGGEKGYGFRKGPFIKYDFLPERVNDFSFAIIAHQWGFYGALALIGLFIVIILCGLEIANRNTDPYGRLLAFGITAMFTVELLVNISMTLGLMPITGLTLPFVSAGGSSLLTSILAIGLLNNIGRARPFSVAPKLFE